MSNKKLAAAAFSAIVFFCCAFAALAQQKQEKSRIPANWKTYSGAAFSFRYPPNLTLKIKNNRVELSHSVKFRHTDPCDANDEPQRLDYLEDFSLAFTIEPAGAVNSETGETTKENWETTSEGSIDTGNLRGSVMLNTAEGCGQYVYTFPATGKTLKIERLQISLFNPTAFQYGDDKRALKLKGVIEPMREIQIFKAIVESIKFK